MLYRVASSVIVLLSVYSYLTEELVQAQFGVLAGVYLMLAAIYLMLAAIYERMGEDK